MESGDDNQLGQFFICVKESRNLKIRGKPGVGAYCVLQLDKQQVRTRGATRSLVHTYSYDSWDEGFTFDITSTNAVMILSIWATNQAYAIKETVDNTQSNFVGQIRIPVASLLHSKPVDQWFKVTSEDPSDPATGEVHLKLMYISCVKKVNVDDFKPLRVVGQGTFAKVMLVQKKDTGRLYAMKIISKKQAISHNAVKHTIAEKNILAKIDHPYIVGLKYSFQTEDKLYLVLDYICGGELFYHLSAQERFTEELAKFYTAELVCAIGYLHSLSIVYRDLKPENVLMDIHGHICLTDFGLCKEGLGFGRITHTFCGSPEYLAPEMFMGLGYDYSVDWWALGTLLYEMLSGLPPFFSEDPDEMSKKISSEPLTFPDYFSSEAKSILSMMIERNPKLRLGAGEGDAEEVKQHSFFAGIDWDKMEKKLVEPPFRPPLDGVTDVRFFDPDSTCQVAKHSYTESYLSDNEQEFFKGFSYVAPESKFNLRRRSRGNSASYADVEDEHSNGSSWVPSLNSASLIFNKSFSSPSLGLASHRSEQTNPTDISVTKSSSSCDSKELPKTWLGRSS